MTSAAPVVDVARDPKHPLHPRFEWDDSIAAEKWRLEQAGQLLRVTFRPDPAKPRDLRAFVAIKGEDSPTSDYKPLEEVAADPFASELLLRQMKRNPAIWCGFNNPAISGGTYREGSDEGRAAGAAAGRSTSRCS